MHRIHKNFSRIPAFKKCYFLLILLIAGFVTVGCENKAAEQNTVHMYYDLKGLIENQIVLLNEKKPKVSKTIILNGKKEVNATANIDWKKELELFTQADINKPAYKNSYLVKNKNASEIEYVLKSEDDLNVQYLKIRMDTVQKQPYLIQALIKSQNKIYKSEKFIELTFTNKNDEWQPTSYSVKGYQKLLLMDPKTFSIYSKIGL